MTKATDPAFPFVDGTNPDLRPGLTKREYFAAMAVGDAVEFTTTEAAAKFVGVDAPDENDFGAMIAFSSSVKAKLKVLEADALIAELAKAEPEDVSAPDGGWVEWCGGMCPVDPSCRVKIQVRDGNTETGDADCFYWLHEGSCCDIMRYLIVKGTAA